MGLFSFIFPGRLRKTFIPARVTFRPFKVIQGHWFWYQSKARMRLPIIVRHSNLGPSLHRFGDIAGFLCSWPTPIPTNLWGCSRWTRSPMLGSIWARTLSYSAVKLFSKYAYRSDHAVSERYRQTDSQSQTDVRTTYCGVIPLCVASCSKK